MQAADLKNRGRSSTMAGTYATAPKAGRVAHMKSTAACKHTGLGHAVPIVMCSERAGWKAQETVQNTKRGMAGSPAMLYRLSGA